jgi:hypothetical protein
MHVTTPARVLATGHAQIPALLVAPTHVVEDADMHMVKPSTYLIKIAYE